MTPQLLLVNPYRTLQGRCVILVPGGLTSGLAAWLSGNSHSTRPRPPLKKAKETLRHHFVSSSIASATTSGRDRSESRFMGGKQRGSGARAGGSGLGLVPPRSPLSPR